MLPTIKFRLVNWVEYQLSIDIPLEVSIKGFIKTHAITDQLTEQEAFAMLADSVDISDLFKRD